MIVYLNSERAPIAMSGRLLLFLATIIATASALNLCNSSSNISSYEYKNDSLQNCNCENSCIRKCCAVGFYATKGVCLRQAVDYVLSVPVYEGQNYLYNVSTDGGILAGALKCDFFPLRPKLYPENEWFYVQKNGSILTSSNGLVGNDRYCVDDISGGGFAAFVCMEDVVANAVEDAIASSRYFNRAGMAISLPFLLATFIAYALLPDRNLHMKALMFYVISLFFAYMCLVIIQFYESVIPDGTCQFLGYFTFFAFTLSFFWMNVICFDIWFTFSGLRGFGGGRGAEKKRFLLYCLYAWGVTVAIIIIVVIIGASVPEASKFHPGIGDGQCFLKRGWPELLYFYGPISLIIITNITLFVTTALRIRGIKAETSMLKKGDSKRHSYENDKQTFNLYVKLLFAMGVNWSMEIISWAVDWQMSNRAPAAIWWATDFCNAIYGVFIFFIFVFKRSIWKLLKKRYYAFVGKPHLAHSMTHNPTRTTSYSTANTSVMETHNAGQNDSSALA